MKTNIPIPRLLLAVTKKLLQKCCTITKYRRHGGKAMLAAQPPNILSVL
jgi:hypothetical protein